MDSKLGAEGRKDLFDWLSRQLSGLSSFAEAAQLLKPAASAMTVCSGYQVSPFSVSIIILSVLMHNIPGKKICWLLLRRNPLMFARQQRLALMRY